MRELKGEYLFTGGVRISNQPRTSVFKRRVGLLYSAYACQEGASLAIYGRNFLFFGVERSQLLILSGGLDSGVVVASARSEK